MRDPYQVLGLTRDASAADVKKAYRKLAKKYHPDSNSGDAAAEAKFSEATVAYDILSNKEKRARFDRGEIDAEGNERPEQAFWRGHPGTGGAGGPGGAEFRSFRFGGGQGGFAAEDLFGDMFGGGGPRGPVRRRGADVAYKLTVDFLTAVNGGSHRITLATGRSLDLRIPPGTVDGQTMRLSGQGEPGDSGGPAGDALVEIKVASHPWFRREGNDLHVDVPIGLHEAVLGARIPVPTAEGRVSLTVPKGSNSGKVLRLRGKGVLDARSGERGDEYVHLQIVLPDPPDPELAEFVERWAEAHSYDPRAKAKMV